MKPTRKPTCKPTSETDVLGWMQDELADLDGQSRLRALREAEPLADGWVRLNGQRVLDLASNDYLGMSRELDLASVTDELAGATASRLVVGNHPAYTALESTMAELKHAEAALVFGSGYLANVGVIPALVGRKDMVFSDRLNHASIIDGITLSRATHKRYRHNDMEHLESMLKAAPADTKKLIVTDALFSMDGDLAPLQTIVELKQRYGAMLMVDEAHSGGTFGPQGAGLASALGVSEAVDVQMGTFSKAYGVYGAYVAGRRVLIDYLINRARSLIFTTGLPPVLVRLIHQSVETVAADEHRRKTLHANAEWFRAQLREAGFDVGPSESQVIPVIVGEDAQALALSDRLLDDGVGCVAIRPPTVPTGTARLRFTLTSAHRRDDLETAVNTLIHAARDLELP